jgi:hypothetical protein
MDEPESIPIWLVVLQDHPELYHMSGGVRMRSLVKVIPCSLHQYRAVWDREVKPLYDANMPGLDWQILLREPDPNPIKEASSEH